MASVWVSPQPIPGLPVKPPRIAPQAGQVVISYETVEPDVGCCKCSDLTTGGLIALIVLVLIFWPLAFIPCCESDCHTQSQCPVYGFPPQYQNQGAPQYQNQGAPQYQPPAPGVPVGDVAAVSV
eukprot:gene5752-6046_t